MTTDVLRAHLFAIRAQVDAILLALEAEAPPAPPPVPDGCQHPTEHRRDASTMGLQMWRCMACGEEFEGAA